MRALFNTSLELLLKHEGGFSNHPRDPGSITNLGVTRRSWEAYVGHWVTEQEMRDLTADKVWDFYKTKYWDLVHGDDLPAGLDFCVFDTCVNSGPNRAVRILQDVLGVSIDGILGPATLTAVGKSPVELLVSAYTTVRLAYLKSLPNWDVFGGGWATRVEEVEREAKQLAGSGAMV